MTVRLVVVGIIIAVAAHTCHVVHRTRNGCLDTGICSGSIEGDASPSAYADDANHLGIDVLQLRQIIDSCHEVLGIDVGRSRATRFTAALTSVRRVEGQRHKSALSHPHGIESTALLFCGSKGTRDRNGRQLFSPLFGGVGGGWRIEVCRQRQAILGFKRHFLVVHLLAQREHFVPLLRQF